MDRLPVRVLLQITPYLTYSEKKRLSATCHRLRDIISDSNLFNEITITRRRAIESFFLETTFYTRQVHSLRLQCVRISLNLLAEIPQCFPNLQDLSCDTQSYSSMAVVSANVENAQSWRTLHCLKSAMHTSSFYLNVLKQGGLHNLTKLIVILARHISCSTFVTLLQNAPCLEHLCFSCNQMRLNDLEQLHRNEPRLETLCMYPQQLMLEGRIAGVIQRQGHANLDVANMLTELRVSFGESGHLLESWMRYIAIKYRTLKTLMMTSARPISGDKSLCMAKLTEIASKCPNLATYRVDMVQIDWYTLHAMDQNGVQLKSITIYKSNVCSQLDCLAASNQRRCLEEIVIAPPLIFSPVGNVPASQSHAFFQAWQQFESLKHLDIQLQSTENSLDDVLIHLQHIQSLTLRNRGIGLKQTVAFTTFRSNLKKLTLKNVRFAENGGDIFGYISKVCTGLSHLTIENCRKSGTLQINFPQHRFVSFIIAMDYTDIYKIKDERRTALYIFNDRVLQEMIPIDENPHAHNLSTVRCPVPRVSIVFKGCVSLKIGDAYIPNW